MAVKKAADRKLTPRTTAQTEKARKEDNAHLVPRPNGNRYADPNFRSRTAEQRRKLKK